MSTSPPPNNALQQSLTNYFGKTIQLDVGHFHNRHTRIEQWVKIPNLPMEYWNADSLSELLKHLGPIVRIGRNTLFHLNGKFARVCVNLDITKPVPCSLSISCGGKIICVPLSYEGLYEVCYYCGEDDHVVKNCAKVGKGKIEVEIDKFGGNGFFTVTPKKCLEIVPMFMPF